MGLVDGDHLEVVQQLDAAAQVVDEDAGGFQGLSGKTVKASGSQAFGEELVPKRLQQAVQEGGAGKADSQGVFTSWEMPATREPRAASFSDCSR